MIDEAVLERLIGEAGSGVSVPVDGPARILAVRDELAPSRRLHRNQAVRNTADSSSLARLTRRASGVGAKPRFRMAWAGLAVVAATAAVIAGFAISDGHRSSPAAIKQSAPKGVTSPITSASAAANQGSYGAIPAASSTSPSVASGTGTSAAAGSSAAPPDEVPSSLPTKVIKTGSLDLQVAVGQIQVVMSQISAETSGVGGFVASSTLNNQGSQETGSPPSGSVSVQVPVGSFDSFVSYVQKLGTTLSVTTSGQDVTSTYVDLEARIQSLQDARSQLQQVLTKADTIGDILSVESQISDLQTQIEQIQGQMDVLDNETTYSTLNVQLTEKAKLTAAAPPPKPPSGLSKAWSHARHTFTHGIEATIGAAGGILAFILIVGFIVVVGRLGWILLRRRLL